MAPRAGKRESLTSALLHRQAIPAAEPLRWPGARGNEAARRLRVNSATPRIAGPRRRVALDPAAGEAVDSRFRRIRVLRRYWRSRPQEDFSRVAGPDPARRPGHADHWCRALRLDAGATGGTCARAPRKHRRAGGPSASLTP